MDPRSLESALHYCCPDCGERRRELPGQESRPCPRCGARPPDAEPGRKLKELLDRDKVAT